MDFIILDFNSLEFIVWALTYNHFSEVGLLKPC